MLKASPGTGVSVEEPVRTPPEPAVSASSQAPPALGPDAESRAWVSSLAAGGAAGEDARRRLHELLLRAARFEINRRRESHPHLRGDDFDDLAHQAAGDAMLAILRKLNTYRGESRFSTWAYKFALLGMRSHLQGCGACNEDHQSLHALLEAEIRPAERGR
jgi:hypothetical protein